MEWTNVVRKLSDLQPWERNPRQINEKQAERLKESFEDFGQVETIAIGPENEIYNGHQRLNVLMDQHGGDYEIECRQSDRALSEKEREKLTVFLHKGAAGEWDWDILANEFEMDDLLDWGFEEGELFGFEQEPKEAPEARVDEAEELLEKWGVESGQLWSLGDHRLICGDCTDKAVVDRLMDGEKAGAVVTDPPYGMNVDVDYANMHHGDGVYTVNRFERVVGDDSPFDPLFLLEMFEYCNEIALFGGDYYAQRLPVGGGWFCWDKRWNDSGMDLDKVRGSVFELIWSKHPHKREIARITWTGHHGMANDDLKSRAHPTQKPLLIMVWLLERIKGNLVVDPFLGSGSTLMACEQLNRKCYGVEIDPKYVAVTLERWHEMTGEMPELI